jgi:hypothetical protein
MRAGVPVENADSLFVPRVRALSRAEVETLVEGLIDLLDAMDGDADLEADHAAVRKGRDGKLRIVGCSSDDEPSLCGLTVHWPSHSDDDREFDEAEGRDPIPDWSGRGVHEVFVGRRA